MTQRTCQYLACLLVLAAAASACQVAVAADPVEIPAGNLLIVRSATAEKWYVAPHSARERSLLVITVDANGNVTMTSTPLPDRSTPTDPDDPEDPPPSLPRLVAQWADDVNDADNRLKLAAAYQATIKLVDDGKIESADQLVSLQRLTNTTLLGGDAAKWSGFFEKLGTWLDANTPADLTGYRTRWLEISEGLRGL